MINFTGKLIVDKSIYNKLKYSSGEKIVETVKPFVEAKNFIINDDITLSAGSYAKGDKVMIKYGDFCESEVASSKGGVTANQVLIEILKLASFKNDIKIRSSRPKVIIQAIKDYYQNKPI